jgi:hypothetical protein
MLCLEEPENGIHPSRIPAILELLHSMAVDSDEAVDAVNPLKQVVINTHSPSVISALNTADVVMVSSVRHAGINQASFDCIAHTWRAKVETEPPGQPPNTVSPGDMLTYVNAAPFGMTLPRVHPSPTEAPKTQTVQQYMAAQLSLDFPTAEGNAP